jgi:hypothetical protein
LADWNTTIRDPNAYTATATVVDNDVRLWLGGWQAANSSYDSNVGNDGAGNATGYDRTPNLVEFDGGPVFTNDVNDPAHGAAADQVHVAQGSAQTGDVELTFVRAGVQAGDIVLNWEVVLDGTASADDFTRLTGTLTLAGGQGSTESTSFSTVIEDLLVADRVVENNETFHLQFTVASIDNAVVGGAANVLFTPNYDKERQGVEYHDSSLNGQARMVVDAVIRNDDLSYGIAWAANTGNADVTIAGVDAKVVEGDDGDTYIDFVVNRALGAGLQSGFHRGLACGAGRGQPGRGQCQRFRGWCHGWRGLLYRVEQHQWCLYPLQPYGRRRRRTALRRRGAVGSVAYQPGFQSGIRRAFHDRAVQPERGLCGSCGQQLDSHFGQRRHGSDHQ